MTLTIKDNIKSFRSEDYNYDFNLVDGFFRRWGKTINDDPTTSIYGPEIADIEISDGESCPVSCPFCYKGNKKGDADKSNHMSLKTFSDILEKFPKYDGHFFTTQIAFGITSVGAHPELFDIFRHCRVNNIIPNLTINGADPLTDEQIKSLIELAGAMAISINSSNKDKGYALINRLISSGAKQINIHFVVSRQSIKFAYTLCEDMKSNPLLKGVNAVVFLGLKPKNRGQHFDVLPTEEFTTLVNHALEQKIPFGFDSCSAPRFERAVDLSEKISAKLKNVLLSCSERCESGNFSSYLDVFGNYWHCSFGEGMPIANGVDVKQVNNFLTDVWQSDKLTTWRNRLAELNRECPLYKEIHIDPTKATGEFPDKV
jgi:sulfatase maturation enzyme AslB (radical SAM superfamily)